MAKINSEWIRCPVCGRCAVYPRLCYFKVLPDMCEKTAEGEIKREQCRSRARSRRICIELSAKNDRLSLLTKGSFCNHFYRAALGMK